MRTPVHDNGQSREPVLTTRAGDASLCGWSLLELLLAMAVIAVLAVVITPAVQGMLQSESRQAAAGKVMATIEQARALAVTQNRDAYVVFADESMDESQRCRAMCIYLDDEDLSKIAPVIQTGWIKLPAGICFRNDLNSLTTAPLAQNSPLFIPPGAANAKAFRYLKFDRTGAVEYPEGSDYLRLLLYTGYVSSSGKLVSLNKSQLHTPLEQITVSRYTGRPKYEPLAQGGSGS